MLSLTEFDRTRRLALSLAGIELKDRHREWLARRCHRHGWREPGALDGMLTRAERGDLPARRHFISLVTTHHTGFLRHPEHFDVASRHVLDRVRDSGAGRVWSAAASTGEEPYSMAWALWRSAGRSRPPVEIVASDIDESVLETARQAAYPAMALRSLPDVAAEELFERPGSAGHRELRPELRAMVSFLPLNLADLEWRLQGPFDVILCRNVLMYLDAGHRYSVLERMASWLGPGGLLFLDPSEHPGPAGILFESRGGGVFSRRLPSRPVSRVCRRSVTVHSTLMMS